MNRKSVVVVMFFATCLTAPGASTAQEATPGDSGAKVGEAGDRYAQEAAVPPAVVVTGDEPLNFEQNAPQVIRPYDYLRIVSGCVGENEAELYKPCQVWFNCDAFRAAGHRLGEAMATRACGGGTTPYTFNFTTKAVRGGGNCGYGHYQIDCLYQSD